MKIFENRPLALACFVFIFSLLLSSLFGTVGKISVFAAGLVLFLLFFFLPARFVRSLISRTACLFLFGAFLLGQGIGHFSFARPASLASPYVGKTVSVCGTVEDVEKDTPYYARFTVCTDTLDGTPLSLTFGVESDAITYFEAGDRVSFEGTLLSLDEGEAERAKGEAGIFTDVENLRFLSNDRLPLHTVKNKLLAYQRALCNKLEKNVDGEGGRLLSAMLLGDKSSLSASVSRDFRRLGLSHLLALSGLHLSVLVYLLSRLLSFFSVGKKPAVFLKIGVIVFYTLLSGLSLSCLRAAIMTAVFSLSFLAGERADSLTSLFFAAAVILLFTPAAVFDVGLWLSLSACFGILAFAEKTKRWKKPVGFFACARRAVLLSFLVSLCAIFATLPITAFFFGEFSLLSPLTNLLLSPLFSLLLSLSPFALLFGGFAPFGTLLSFLSNSLLSLCQWVATWPGIALSLSYLPLQIVLFLIVGGCFVLLVLPKQKTRVLLAFSGVCVFAFALTFTLVAYENGKQSELYYRRTGTAECLFVQDGFHGLYIDVSKGEYACVSSVAELQKEAHLCELDGVFYTHYHAKTPETFEKLASNTVVRTLYLPAPTSESEESLFLTLCEAAARTGTAVTVVSPYDEVAFSSLTWIPHASGNFSSHPSLGVTVVGEKTFTYLGRGMSKSDKAATAHSFLAASDFAVFGMHGAGDGDGISFGNLPSLRLVLAGGGISSLSPSFLSCLEENGTAITDGENCRFSLK